MFGMHATATGVMDALTHPLHLGAWLAVLALALAKEWPRRQVARPALVALALVLGARYLVWRGLHSLNHVNVYAYAVSVALYGAEVFGCVSMLLFYLQAMWPKARTPAQYSEDEAPTVDVFVTIYDEPEAILSRTLTAIAAMDYAPGRMRIYVLDDGRRDSIKRLAERFGAGYITRSANTDAKAGNINNALPLSRGEVIALFDCDHIPVRTFLKETVGFFRDPGVAIVQTPHNFYNSDTFQRNLFLERRLRNEQELFYNVLMPGRDRFNAAFFTGTSGLIRRKALTEAGGFRVTSLIEDLYTSMELHARGWKSVYWNKVLTGALMPESFLGYLRQHKRWSRGGVQVFVTDNPLFKSGLSAMQRLHYFGSLLYFFHGLPRIVYLLAPLPFLYFNVSPLSAPTLGVLAVFLPYYVATQASFALLTRRYRNPFWSDVYETADAFSMAGSAIEGLLLPEKVLFQVTPKRAKAVTEKTGWGHIAPHIVVAALLLGGMIATVTRVAWGRALTDAAVLSLLWTVYNLLLLVVSIGAGRERPRARGAYRLHRRLVCRFHSGEKAAAGWTHDISETGAFVRVVGAERLPERVEVSIRCRCGDRLRTGGAVVWQKPRGGGGVSAGVRFDGMSEGQLQAVTRLMFSCPRSWSRMHHPLLAARESLNAMLTAFSEVFETSDLDASRKTGVWSGKK